MMINSIKKNYLLNVSYELLILIIPLVTSPYIARVLGAEKLGEYSFSTSISSYFVFFARLGIKTYGQRSIAKVRNNIEELTNIFSEIFTIQLVSSIIVILSYITFLQTQRDSDLFLIMLIQAIYVLSALLDINWFYFGLEKFKLTVTRNFIIKILNLIFVFVFVKTKNDIWIYTLINSVGIILSFVPLWVLLKRYIKFKLPDKRKILLHLSPILFLFIPELSRSIYLLMDKIMLGIMSQKVQLGFYDNAEKIIKLPMGILAALGTVMLPRMSFLYSNGETEKAEKYIEKSFNFVFFIASILVFGLAGISDVFAVVFWGVDFSYTSLLIKILAPIIFFIQLGSILRSQVLFPKGRDKVQVFSVAVGGVINIISNLVLIPILGSAGAAISTLITEAIIFFAIAIILRKEVNIKKYFIYGIPFILVGFLMLIVLQIIGDTMKYSIQTLIIQICAGGGTYIFLITLFYYFKRREMFFAILDYIKICLKKN